MLDEKSRYYAIDNATLDSQGPDGTLRQIVYKRRRFIPPADGGATLIEHPVADGQRLDNITAQYLGDPAQFWRLCDSNGARFPDDLTAQVGAIIKITLPRL